MNQTLPTKVVFPARGLAPYTDFPSFIAHVTAAGSSIYFEACEGNNGDDLIGLGARSVFARTKARLVDDPAQAGVIVINGGGMFVEGFKQGLAKVRQFSEAFPDKLLCIGPQSFQLTSPTLREILQKRRAPTVICVREAPSVKNLEPLLAGLAGIELLADHDLAFHIDADDEVLRHPQAGRHVLIVERQDGEHRSHRTATEANRKMPAYRKLLHRLLPAAVKSRLKRLRLRRKSAELTPFRQWVEAHLQQEHPEAFALPRVALDLSQRELATFDEFVSTIAASEVIFTDRLHVGILGARLGKRTYLFEGNYHKCRGIYERSLKSNPRVTLVPPSVFPGTDPHR